MNWKTLLALMSMICLALLDLNSSTVTGSGSGEGEIPATLTDSLTACDVTLFPNIKVLLTIAVTIPVTSCESERSFSQLKLIKTAHRSTMTADRLSGLALMKINRERCDQIFKSADDMNGVIHLFFQMHPRRMNMPCLLVDK